MRLGFAVKVLGDGGLPSHETRRWQSGPALAVSLERLRAIPTLGMLDFKQMRVGLAVAVLLDATIVRAVPLPATMNLGRHPPA